MRELRSLAKKSEKNVLQVNRARIKRATSARCWRNKQLIRTTMTNREKTEAINLYGDWTIENLQWVVSQPCTSLIVKHYIRFILSIR